MAETLPNAVSYSSMSRAVYIAYGCLRTTKPGSPFISILMAPHLQLPVYVAAILRISLAKFVLFQDSGNALKVL
jgi:hypothetical protein